LVDFIKIIIMQRANILGLEYVKVREIWSRISIGERIEP